MPLPTDQFQSMGFEEQKKFVEKLQDSLTEANTTDTENQLKANRANELVDYKEQLKSPSPEKVKQVRMFVDNLIIQSKEIKPSRETSLAYTNMQRGFMWLGKVLQGLDQPNPYPESTNIHSPKIEERTDQAKDSPILFEGCPFIDGDQTASIKWFRNQLDSVINQIDFGYCNRAADNAEDAFAEAKMWYGQELNNIRLATT